MSRNVSKALTWREGGPRAHPSAPGARESPALGSSPASHAKAYLEGYRGLAVGQQDGNVNDRDGGLLLLGGGGRLGGRRLGHLGRRLDGDVLGHGRIGGCGGVAPLGAVAQRGACVRGVQHQRRQPQQQVYAVLSATARSPVCRRTRQERSSSPCPRVLVVLVVSSGAVVLFGAKRHVVGRAIA